MAPEEYFKFHQSINKKRYDALYAFFVDKLPAAKVADTFGYTLSSFYSLVRDFRKYLNEGHREDFFFKNTVLGRKPNKEDHLTDSTLPITQSPIEAILSWKKEKFHSLHTGLFAFLPTILQNNIHRLIERSDYPSDDSINKLSAILCFLALKLSNIKKYPHDDLWRTDRGMGLFAGLSVLPDMQWFSDYSDKINVEMNLSFLRELHETWCNQGLLSDTINLDFTSIPYRNKSAISGMPAILAQDSESGIIDYVNCNINHCDEQAIVLGFLDFYSTSYKNTPSLKYLVFDGKFTNYQNLAELDERKIKFITIRRRGEKMMEQIKKISEWKTIQVEGFNVQKTSLKVNEQNITLSGYKNDKTGKAKDIRQVVIEGNFKIKPTVLLTNDFELPIEVVIRKYFRRLLDDKDIAQQIDFFHLNRQSASFAIKIDFDLVLTILAHNLYRLLALSLGRYRYQTDEMIYDRFIANSGEIAIKESEIRIDLKKKKELSLLMEHLNKLTTAKYPWLENKKLHFNPTGAT